MRQNVVGEKRESTVSLLPPVLPLLSVSYFPSLLAVSRFHPLPLDRPASRINVSEIQLRVP